MFFSLCMRTARRLGVAVLFSLSLIGDGSAFERSDLATITNRLIFFERPPYAVGASRAVADREAKGKTDLTVYYISTNWYDPLFTVSAVMPIDIRQTPEAVTFRQDTTCLTLDSEGILYTLDRAFTNDISGAPLMRIVLDSIRFDEAAAISKRDGKIIAQRVQPYALSPLVAPPLLPQAERLFAETNRFEPETVIRTAEGLWTCWRFDLKSEGSPTFLDSRGAKLMIGSGKTIMFYNAATKAKAGEQARMAMRFRVQPDESFPLPAPPAVRPTLVDTHVHMTTTTDLRDSILMARRQGYQYWAVSILYNEHPPYGRLFTGNDQLFEAMRRAPDVFLGFGHLQLNKNGFPGFPQPGPDTPAHIQRMWEQGCVGLKTLVKFSKYDVQVDDPQYDPLWAKAADLHMPIVFHTETEDTGSSHARVAAVARRFPGSPMILAHLGSGQIEVTVRELKATPNLYIQHMHLGLKAADGRTALERLVAEGLTNRILFGSDVTSDHTPLIAERNDLVLRLRALHVPEGAIEGILFATAKGIIERVTPRPEAR